MLWQPGVTLEDLERETILTALRFYGGNRTHAASALGIALRTLTGKLTKYKDMGLQVPEATIGGRFLPAAKPEGM